MRHRTTRDATRPVLIGALLLALIGCTATHAEEGTTADTLGELIEDIVMTEHVYLKLMDEQFLGDAVLEVEASAGTVWLSGYVAREEDRARALELAQSVEGVEAVQNGICVLDIEPGCFPDGAPGAEGPRGLDSLPGA